MRNSPVQKWNDFVLFAGFVILMVGMVCAVVMVVKSFIFIWNDDYYNGGLWLVYGVATRIIVLPLVEHYLGNLFRDENEKN